MSLFRRKLLAKRGGEDKPNLAIVRENTVSVDSLEKRKAVKTGITAKRIEKGKTYHVTFDVEFTVLESSPTGYSDAMLGNYIPWGSGAAFLHEFLPNSGTVKRSIDKTIKTIGNVKEGDDGLIFWTQKERKAALHIYNVVITEV